MYLKNQIVFFLLPFIFCDAIPQHDTGVLVKNLNLNCLPGVPRSSCSTDVGMSRRTCFETRQTRSTTSWRDTPHSRDWRDIPKNMFRWVLLNYFIFSWKKINIPDISKNFQGSSINNLANISIILRTQFILFSHDVIYRQTLSSQFRYNLVSDGSHLQKEIKSSVGIGIRNTRPSRYWGMENMSGPNS